MIKHLQLLTPETVFVSTFSTGYKSSLLAPFIPTHCMQIHEYTVYSSLVLDSCSYCSIIRYE